MSETPDKAQINVDEKPRSSGLDKTSLHEVEAVPGPLPKVHSATELAHNVGLQEFLECKEAGLSLVSLVF